MDWAKAKSIIIVALIAANLFLIIMFVVLKAEDTSDEMLIQKQTIALLEQKNIHVETNVPIKHDEMPVLNVKYDRLDTDFLENKLKEQIPLPVEDRNKKELLAMTEDFLKTCGIWSNNVVLDQYQKNGDSITISYRNEYDKMRIEDSYIICTVADGKVKALDRHWLTPIDFGRTKRATMSASAALVSFMKEKDAEESITIEKVELVYWIDSNAYEGNSTISDTAFPAWKITYNNDKIKHISAYGE
jgi:regulatory protein YycI of two-component signal transduction system YycFG